MRALAERRHRKTGRRFPLARARQVQENKKQETGSTPGGGHAEWPGRHIRDQTRERHDGAPGNTPSEYPLFDNGSPENEQLPQLMNVRIQESTPGQRSWARTGSGRETS